MRTVGVIPARLQSTRLTHKMLLAETGWPLVRYAWEAAAKSRALSDLIVATDSAEIAEVVRGFGGRCELTGDVPSGTDRVAEIARRVCPDADVLLNIQGDEPEIDPGNIDALVAAIRDFPGAEMATLASPLTKFEELADPSCVKVVLAADGRALYFSRSMIPFSRDDSPETLLAAGDSPWLLHMGLYAYRREFLLDVASRPQCRLEQVEKLEQLRALDMGARIQVAVVEHRSVGIDTPDDYARFVKRQRAKTVCDAVRTETASAERRAC
ncbi:MAG: 3-deoxy-manno-octulosonate cytidylyltransferase [Planctomycetales bacterium]